MEAMPRIIKKLQKDIEKAGGTNKLVAAKLNGIKLSDGNVTKADGQLAGTPSQIFDAVAVVLSKDGTNMMMKEGAAIQWVMDAFGHLKAIGYTKDAMPLLEKAGVEIDEGVIEINKQFIAAATKRFFAQKPYRVRNLA